jgi:hypothetical protein
MSYIALLNHPNTIPVATDEHSKHEPPADSASSDAFVGFSSAAVERVFEAIFEALVAAIRPAFGTCLHS